MAFNINAQVVLSGPKNLGKIKQSIQKSLGGSIPVNLTFSPKAAANLAAFNSQLNQATASLQKITGATNAFSGSLGKAAQTASTFSSSLASSATKAANVATSVQKVSQSSQAVTASLAQATNQMQSFGREAAQSVRKFGAFTLVTGAIYGFVRSVQQATKDAIEFQREMSRLRVVSDATDSQIKDFQGTVDQLSTSLGLSSNEIAKVGVTIAQSGRKMNEVKNIVSAIAKASLTPSFGDMEDTAEGVIAVLEQFQIAANRTESVLGSLNAVSKAFAVESADLISVIRKTGGVFATASGQLREPEKALAELLGIFTSVRATTRESADTIATGLRTIFSRLQRKSTIDFLKQFQIDLVDTEGKFVGFFESFRRLSEGLSGIQKAGDVLTIAKIVEELGGIRQVGKLIPAIQQFTKAEQARRVALQGTGSITRDVAVATETLSVKIQQLQQRFVKLVRDVADSESFQNMAKFALSAANAFVSLADSLRPLLPMLTTLAAIKISGAAFDFSRGFVGGLKKKHDGGSISRFARGGLVPGQGNRDSVPAALTPGEFVIRKSSVEKLGTGYLNSLNRNAGGVIPAKYSNGNKVKNLTNYKKSIEKYYDTGRKSDNNVDDTYNVTLIRKAIEGTDRKTIRKQAEQIYDNRGRGSVANRNENIKKYAKKNFRGSEQFIQNLGYNELRGKKQSNLNKIAGGLAENLVYKQLGGSPSVEKLKNKQGADFRYKSGDRYKYAEVKTNQSRVTNNEIIAKYILARGTQGEYRNKQKDNIGGTIEFYYADYLKKKYGGGAIRRYAVGGIARQSTVGAAALTSEGFLTNQVKEGSITVDLNDVLNNSTNYGKLKSGNSLKSIFGSRYGKDEFVKTARQISGISGAKTWTTVQEGIGKNQQDRFYAILDQGSKDLVSNAANSFAQEIGMPLNPIRFSEKYAFTKPQKGYLFESVVDAIGSRLVGAGEEFRPFDYTNGINVGKKLFKSLKGVKYVDARTSGTSERDFTKKATGQLGEELYQAFSRKGQRADRSGAAKATLQQRLDVYKGRQAAEAARKEGKSLVFSDQEIATVKNIVATSDSGGITSRALEKLIGRGRLPSVRSDLRLAKKNNMYYPMAPDEKAFGGLIQRLNNGGFGHKYKKYSTDPTITNPKRYGYTKGIKPYTDPYSEMSGAALINDYVGQGSGKLQTLFNKNPYRQLTPKQAKSYISGLKREMTDNVPPTLFHGFSYGLWNIISRQLGIDSSPQTFRKIVGSISHKTAQDPSIIPSLIGKSFGLPGFLSTSISDRAAARFTSAQNGGFLRILTNQAKKGINVQKYAGSKELLPGIERLVKSEGEFILSKGNKFSIRSIRSNRLAGDTLPEFTVQQFANGGGTSDTVPALLTPGEFVMSRPAAQKIGYSNLSRMNHLGKHSGGAIQKFASGGIVQQFQGGGAAKAALGALGTGIGQAAFSIPFALSMFQDSSASDPMAMISGIAILTGVIESVKAAYQDQLQAQAQNTAATNQNTSAQAGNTAAIVGGAAGGAAPAGKTGAKGFFGRAGSMFRLSAPSLTIPLLAMTASAGVDAYARYQGRSEIAGYRGFKDPTKAQNAGSYGMLENALKYGAVGAGIGSFFGPGGIIVGGLLGAGIGAFGFGGTQARKEQQRFTQLDNLNQTAQSLDRSFKNLIKSADKATVAEYQSASVASRRVAAGIVSNIGGLGSLDTKEYTKQFKEILDQGLPQEVVDQSAQSIQAGMQQILTTIPDSLYRASGDLGDDFNDFVAGMTNAINSPEFSRLPANFQRKLLVQINQMKDAQQVVLLGAIRDISNTMETTGPAGAGNARTFREQTKKVLDFVSSGMGTDEAIAASLEQYLSGISAAFATQFKNLGEGRYDPTKLFEFAETVGSPVIKEQILMYGQLMAEAEKYSAVAFQNQKRQEELNKQLALATANFSAFSTAVATLSSISEEASRKLGVATANYNMKMEEILSGSSKVLFKEKENIFSNLRGRSATEINAAAQTLNKELFAGRANLNSVDIGGMLTFSQKLPEILKTAVKNLRSDSGYLNTGVATDQLMDSIRSQFAGFDLLPESARQQLRSALQASVEGLRQDADKNAPVGIDTIKDKLINDPEFVKTLIPQSEELAKTFENLQNASNDYKKALTDAANNAVRASQLQTQAFLSALDKISVLNQIKNPYQTKNQAIAQAEKDFSRRLDVILSGTNIDRTNLAGEQERLIQEKILAENTGDMKKQTELAVALNKVEKAIEYSTNETERLTAIQNKLASIEESRLDSRQKLSAFLNELAGAKNPMEAQSAIQDFFKSAYAAERIRQTGGGSIQDIASLFSDLLQGPNSIAARYMGLNQQGINQYLSGTSQFLLPITQGLIGQAYGNMGFGQRAGETAFGLAATDVLGTETEQNLLTKTEKIIAEQSSIIIDSSNNTMKAMQEQQEFYRDEINKTLKFMAKEVETVNNLISSTQIANNITNGAAAGAASAATKARGGIVYASRGTLVEMKEKGTDIVPAMLTPGEFVVNREATKDNLPLLTAINGGMNIGGDSLNASGGGFVRYFVKGGNVDGGDSDRLQEERNYIKAKRQAEKLGIELEKGPNDPNLIDPTEDQGFLASVLGYRMDKLKDSYRYSQEQENIVIAKEQGFLTQQGPKDPSLFDYSKGLELPLIGDTGFMPLSPLLKTREEEIKKINEGVKSMGVGPAGEQVTDRAIGQGIKLISKFAGPTVNKFLKKYSPFGRTQKGSIVDENLYDPEDFITPSSGSGGWLNSLFRGARGRTGAIGDVRAARRPARERGARQQAAMQIEQQVDWSSLPNLLTNISNRPRTMSRMYKDYIESVKDFFVQKYRAADPDLKLIIRLDSPNAQKSILGNAANFSEVSAAQISTRFSRLKGVKQAQDAAKAQSAAQEISGKNIQQRTLIEAQSSEELAGIAETQAAMQQFGLRRKPFWQGVSASVAEERNSLQQMASLARRHFDIAPPSTGPKIFGPPPFNTYSRFGGREGMLVKPQKATENFLSTGPHTPLTLAPLEDAGKLNLPMREVGDFQLQSIRERLSKIGTDPITGIPNQPVPRGILKELPPLNQSSATAIENVAGRTTPQFTTMRGAARSSLAPPANNQIVDAAGNLITKTDPIKGPYPLENILLPKEKPLVSIGGRTAGQIADEAIAAKAAAAKAAKAAEIANKKPNPNKWLNRSIGATLLTGGAYWVGSDYIYTNPELFSWLHQSSDMQADELSAKRLEQQEQNKERAAQQRQRVTRSQAEAAANQAALIRSQNAAASSLQNYVLPFNELIKLKNENTANEEARKKRQKEKQIDRDEFIAKMRARTAIENDPRRAIKPTDEQQEYVANRLLQLKGLSTAADAIVSTIAKSIGGGLREPIPNGIQTPQTPSEKAEAAKAKQQVAKSDPNDAFNRKDEYQGYGFFTDNTGKFRVKAKFLNLSKDGQSAILEKNDGTVITVPLDRLSRQSLMSIGAVNQITSNPNQFTDRTTGENTFNRVWQDARGRTTSGIKYAGRTANGSVQVSDESGKTYIVPYDQLSDQDKAWIQNTFPWGGLAAPQAQTKSRGGVVYARGGGSIHQRGTDTAPAMLTPGEFVVNKQASQENLPLLMALNSGRNISQFAKTKSRGGIIYAQDGGAITAEGLYRQMQVESAVSALEARAARTGLPFDREKATQQIVSQMQAQEQQQQQAEQVQNQFAANYNNIKALLNGETKDAQGKPLVDIETSIREQMRLLGREPTKKEERIIRDIRAAAAAGDLKLQQQLVNNLENQVYKQQAVGQKKAMMQQQLQARGQMAAQASAEMTMSNMEYAGFPGFATPNDIGPWLIDPATGRPNVQFMNPMQMQGWIINPATGRPNFATGGPVVGQSGIDKIPAMLSDGEYVIKKSSALALGGEVLDHINKNGKLPIYRQMGGEAGAAIPSRPSGGAGSLDLTKSFSQLYGTISEAFNTAGNKFVGNFAPVVDTFNNIVTRLENLPALKISTETKVAPIEVILNAGGLQQIINSTVMEQVANQVGQQLKALGLQRNADGSLVTK